MGVIWTMAWRNTWRQRRRTVLTVSTIGLGLVLILLFWGISDGTVQQMVESTVRMGSGHVLIQQQGYQQSRASERYLRGEPLRAAERWLEQARAIAPIEHIARRSYASGLASSADGAAGVLIMGIEPGPERPASRFFEMLASGRFLEPADEAQAVLGSGVARRLAVREGDRVVLMAQSTSGELESLLVRVAGTLRTRLEEMDERLVLVPLATAQRLLALGEGLHQIAVVLGEAGASEALAGAGQARLQGMEVLAWPEAHPELVDMVRLLGVRNAFISLLIFTLVAFLVFNTLLMAVMERTRELSLLDAVGLTPARRFAMVMAEGAVIAALGCALGLVLGYAIHWYFATAGLSVEALFSGDVALAGTVLDPVLYSRLSARRIVQILALVFAMTLVLALAPAWRAARPAEVAKLGTR
jgi:putative ABC transport system permease protein